MGFVWGVLDNRNDSSLELNLKETSIIAHWVSYGSFSVDFKHFVQQILKGKEPSNYLEVADDGNGLMLCGKKLKP